LHKDLFEHKKNIVVPTNCKEFANTLYNDLKEKAQVKLITGDTPQEDIIIDELQSVADDITESFFMMTIDHLYLLSSFIDCFFG
jgi:hypothetical protein